MKILAQNRLSLSICLIIIGIFGFIIFMKGNEDLFLFINQKLNPALGQAARLFSLLGESWVMAGLLVLSFKMPFRQTLLVGFTWLSAAIHSWIFKLWLCKGWPRPFEFYSQKGIVLNLVDGVKLHHWNTFPSGHTLTAFSIVFLIRALYPKLPSQFTYLAILLASFCGFSRIILVQHWPMDVLGGMVLGCSAALSAQWLHNRFLQETAFSKSLISMLKRES